MGIKRYHLLATILVTGTLCGLFAAGELRAQQSLQPHKVKDLSYGLALYHYFQQDELAAITRLLVAEQAQAGSQQPDESDLLLADLYYSYDLLQESNRLFTRLLDESTPAELKDRVWFNLARLNYYQGENQSAAELLSRISDRLPPFYESERHYLLTDLHLVNGQFERARESLQKISASSVWSAYATYNLGVSLIENNQFDVGKSYLTRLQQLTPATEELAALHDQSNLALGYSYLKQLSYKNALTHFSRVRLDGLLTNEALLGAGWARSHMQQIDQAMVPWVALSQKNEINAATQEALLAIPATFEKNQQPVLAAQFYEHAASEFSLQIQKLERVIDAISQNDLILALQQHDLVANPLAFEQQPPRSVATPYLHILLASEEFQREIKRYRELLNIRISLEHWSNNLPTLSLMVAERRASFAQKIPLLEKSTDLDKLAQLQQTRDRLAERLEQVEQQQDYNGLASDEERDYLDRLDRVAQSLVRINTQKDTREQADMHRLLSGLLGWKISTQYAPRFWAAKKQLIALDRALLESSQSALRLSQIQSLAGSRFADYDARIFAHSSNIESLYRRVAQLIRQQEIEINQLAVESIRQQQNHIAQLRLNARYSLASLYDRLVEE